MIDPVSAYGAKLSIWWTTFSKSRSSKTWTASSGPKYSVENIWSVGSSESTTVGRTK